MRILSCALVATMLVARPLPSLAISSFEAQYDISRGVVTVGLMSRRLTVDDDQRYRYESHMAPRGIATLFARDAVIETSSGRLEGTRFVPEHYSYDKGGAKKDFTLSFDYASNTVHLGGQPRSWSADMPANVLDKLVYQIQLMLDLPAEPTTLEYAIADKGKLKVYRITNHGRETTDTGVGQLTTIKLQRGDDDSERRTTVWCAEELGWMPVKVEYRDEDGSVTVAVISSLQID